MIHENRVGYRVESSNTIPDKEELLSNGTEQTGARSIDR
jgi:hypothetical protein